MQRLLIAAPWLPALCTPIYVYDQWDRIPARIAVAFFQGSPSGWSSKSTALPPMLGLMIASLMGSSTTALTDESSDRIKRLRLIMTGHWIVGFLMPLSLWHVVSWNLGH
jgi:hypothetical protein